MDGALALAQRGVGMLRAKRAMEALLEAGRTVVPVPMVENQEALTADLARAGIAAAPVEPSWDVDVRALRERLRLTRQQFAARYGLDMEAVRNWETGRRKPDMTARSYLRAISNDPQHVEQAYAPTPTLR